MANGILPATRRVSLELTFLLNSQVHGHPGPEHLKSITQKSVPAEQPRETSYHLDGKCNIPASSVVHTAGGRVPAGRRAQAPSVFLLRHPCICPILEQGRGRATMLRSVTADPQVPGGLCPGSSPFMRKEALSHEQL